MPRPAGAGAFTVLATLVLHLTADMALADQAIQHDTDRIAQMAVGIFCNAVPSRSFSDSNTIKGTVERMDANPTLAVESQTVPAIERIMFGVQARERVENGTVLITVTHPPLGPQGATMESWETMMERQRDTVHAYYLGLSDGSPVGRWTISGSAKGNVLFYAEFDVVPVEKGTGDPCRPMLAS